MKNKNLKPPSERTFKKFLRLPEVISKTGLSRSGIYERMSQGQFPIRVNLGGRSVGWLESEIDRWIEERLEERNSQGGASC